MEPIAAATDQEPQGVAHNQAIFVLKSQDITSDLLVDLWVSIQQEIADDVKHGMTVEESIETLRFDHFMGFPMKQTGNPKWDEALTIAEAMRAHPNRKLAD